MLPQMNDKFARFIKPADNNRHLIHFLAAVIFLTLTYSALSFAILLGFAAASSYQAGTEFWDAFAQIIRDIADPTEPWDMIILLSTFFGMFIAIWATTRIFRRQKLSALVGTGPVIRNFAIASLIMSPVALIGLLVPLWTGDALPNLEFGTWALWMLVALPILFLQVTTEELIFRGYLLQEFAIRFPTRWIWILIPAVIFGFLHYAPSSFGSNALIVVGITTFFGIIATDVTVRTGNLGASTGLHFMNNLQAMLLLSLDGTLNGLSLFVTKTHVSDEPAVRLMLLTSVGYIAVLYIIYLVVMRWREQQ